MLELQVFHTASDRAVNSDEKFQFGRDGIKIANWIRCELIEFIEYVGKFEEDQKKKLKECVTSGWNKFELAGVDEINVEVATQSSSSYSQSISVDLARNNDEVIFAASKIDH